MKEKKVVVDTNVVVSAFISGGHSQKIVEAWGKGKLRVVISRELQQEINEVLDRDKFVGKIARKKGALGKLFNKATMIHPEPLESLLFGDRGDHFLLELASSSSAWAIVTGDRELLKMGKIGKTQILEPKEFCKKYKL